MKALLLIDIQNDFVPGGALAVKEANAILPLVNEMVHYSFDLIVATKDWHPSDHGSFANNHEGKEPGDQINLGGLDQVLWPAHCVQGTLGAEFAPGWDTTEVDKIIYKGTDPLMDSYSAFYDNGHRKATGLEVYLREKGINEVFFAGLATDFCVKYSVLDALELGFRANVIVDACRGVNMHPQDSAKALALMQAGNAGLVFFRDLKDLLKAEDKGRRVL